MQGPVWLDAENSCLGNGDIRIPPKAVSQLDSQMLEDPKHFEIWNL